MTHLNSGSAKRSRRGREAVTLEKLPRTHRWNVAETATPAWASDSGVNVFGLKPIGMSRALVTAMTNLNRPPINDPETHAIFGAAITVHRKMGRGFLEHVYAPCLAIELQRQGIPFEQEVALPVQYDEIPLPVSFRVDFVCYGSIVVEVKALPRLTPREEAQLMNYLKAANMHRGLLLNFGEEILGKKRIVWNLPPDLDPLHRAEIATLGVAEHPASSGEFVDSQES